MILNTLVSYVIQAKTCHDYVLALNQLTDVILKAMDTTGKQYLNYDVLSLLLKISYGAWTKCVVPVYGT